MAEGQQPKTFYRHPVIYIYLQPVPEDFYTTGVILKSKLKEFKILSQHQTVKIYYGVQDISIVFALNNNEMCI